MSNPSTPIITKQYKPKPHFYRFDVHAGGDDEYLDARCTITETGSENPYGICVKTDMNATTIYISRAKLIAMGKACLELARAK